MLYLSRHSRDLTKSKNTCLQGIPLGLKNDMKQWANRFMSTSDPSGPDTRSICHSNSILSIMEKEVASFEDRDGVQKA